MHVDFRVAIVVRLPKLQGRLFFFFFLKIIFGAYLVFIWQLSSEDWQESQMRERESEDTQHGATGQTQTQTTAL